MKKIIVFGSLNMDLSIQTDRIPQNGETIDGSAFFTTPGGKGANQAVAAAKSGAKTCLIGTVGDDFFGSQLIEALQSYDVDCTYISKTKKCSTGVAMIIRNEGDNRIIRNPSANHTLDSRNVADILNKVIQQDDIFLTQFENDYLTTLHSIMVAKMLGAFTVLNPAPAKTIPDELYQHIDLLVVNQLECEFLTGIYPTTETDCNTAIKHFADKGLSATIITLGSLGSFYGKDNETMYLPSCNVEIVDTTAAGDSYIGALLHSMLINEEMYQSMIYATKAAAITISKLGSQQTIPSRKEILGFLKSRHTTA